MFVAVVHVAADADGAFRGEPLFSRFLAAHVVEHLAVVDEQDVGDDLFELGVGLRSGPRGEEIVFARQQGWEIVLHIEGEALESPKLLEKGTPHHKDHFIGHKGRVSRGVNSDSIRK